MTRPIWRWQRRWTTEPVPLLTADARLARAIEDHADVPVVLAV
jgi:hypothetical protein